MKHLVKKTVLGLYKYTGAMSLQERLERLAGRSFLTVLLFHRVTDDVPEDGITVGTRFFREVCRLLQRRFHTVSLAQAMKVLHENKRPPRRMVAVTFDDCYRDNLDAARVLADHDLPACFFIPTAYVGTNHVFEWDRELKPMPNLNWEEVKEMARLGHEIGSHTVTHPDMGSIHEDHAHHELVESKRVLEDRLGSAVRWFAFPFGDKKNCPPARLPLVWNAGYEACFSAHGGFITPGTHREVLPREPVPCFRDLLNFELHLSGCLCWTYALRRKMGLL